MKFYFAPMEGITGCLYRNIHHKYYAGIDRYFTPFLSPGPDKGIGRKELRDVLPENNRGVPVVPQILTNRAGDFIKAARLLSDFGYQEVNLNLGCPSGTVVSKKKGSGFLAYPDELDAFLYQIFSETGPATGMDISVKTRIGRDSAEEFPRLLEIFNQYPIRELTIHPRLRIDYYKNTPDWDRFDEAVRESKNPLVYNGDILLPDDFQKFTHRFPQVEAVMMGRGMISDPMLAEKIENRERVTDVEGCLEKKASDMGPIEKEELERLSAFLDELCLAYREIFSGDKNVLFKMKEIWCYIMKRFPESAKAGKKIKKAQNLQEYLAAVEELLRR